MSDLTATVNSQGGVSIIHIAGYLSSESASSLDEAFQQVGEAEKILLVFQEKDFITSAGLAVLFDLILPPQVQGQQVRIVHPSKHFRKVFDIVGMSQDVDVFAAEKQALVGW